MRIETAMNHNQNDGLLKMIRRTDPMIPDVGNKMRLYCLRLSDKILVFGNGGVKDTTKWQESEELAPYVKLLMDTSRFISSRMSDGSLVLVDKEIIGNLNFTRNEEE